MKPLLSFLSLLSIASVLHAAAAESDAKLAGLWEGPLKVGAVELRLGFAITAKPDGSLTATMDSIDQGAKDIPIDKVDLADKKLTLELPKLKASFTGTIAADGTTIKGEWKQGGLTLPLELMRVEKFSTVRRPQTPKKPYSYEEEEVTVENKGAGVKLAGTLTKPKGQGPFRAAILITGSGPQDRDETLFGHKPFLLLADYLTRKGIAVLRCDDRGVDKSTGEHDKATSADFATDVRAQVAFLKERADIKDIGLIGHSEGGLIAPMVAAGNPDVAFIVLLAGTGVAGEELLLMQGQALLKAAKADEKSLKWQYDLQTRLFKLIKDGASDKQLTTALDDALKEIPNDVHKMLGDQASAQFSKLLTTPWLRFFLRHDPRNDLRKVHCPVLALNGEKDTQVPPKENLGQIEKALKAAGNKNVTIREFPDLNHLFQNCKTGLPGEYGKIEETMAPVVLEAIGDWIGKLK
jgi:pimeloyl-ACP methyl ester carboxylesterase